MYEDKLIEWFYEKLFNCFVINADGNIKYLVYDKQFVRDYKICNVL